jgi:hypothetical protein
MQNQSAAVGDTSVLFVSLTVAQNTAAPTRPLAHFLESILTVKDQVAF